MDKLEYTRGLSTSDKIELAKTTTDSEMLDTLVNWDIDNLYAHVALNPHTTTSTLKKIILFSYDFNIKYGAGFNCPNSNFETKKAVIDVFPPIALTQFLTKQKYAPNRTPEVIEYIFKRFKYDLDLLNILLRQEELSEEYRVIIDKNIKLINRLKRQAKKVPISIEKARELLSLNSPDIILSLASNKSIPYSFFNEIWEKGVIKGDDLYALKNFEISHPDIPLEEIEHNLDYISNNPSLTEILLSSRELPIDIVSDLKYTICLKLAQTTKSETVLRNLAKTDREWRIQEEVAKNHYTPIDVFITLSLRTDSLAILEALQENPNVPEDIKEQADQGVVDYFKMEAASKVKSYKISPMVDYEKTTSKTIPSKTNPDLELLLRLKAHLNK